MLFNDLTGTFAGIDWINF